MTPITGAANPPSLEKKLAYWRETALRLRHTGHAHEADLIEKICDEVSDSSREYLTYITEDDAMGRSGKSIRWLRSRFAEWCRAGNARLDRSGRREYRLCVLPLRPNLSAAREAGRQIARNDQGRAA